MNMGMSMGNQIGIMNQAPMMQMGMGQNNMMQMGMSQNNMIQMGMMNQTPRMQMGIGMNPQMRQLNEDNNNSSDVIRIIFRISNNINSSVKLLFVKAFEDDDFSYVQKRFLRMIKVHGNISYYFNYKKLNLGLTVSQLGIANNSNIFVVGDKNSKIELLEEDLINKDFQDEGDPKNEIQLIFKTTQGRTHKMYFSPQISIGLAIQKYLKRVYREESIDSIDKKVVFLFNAKRLSVKDKTSLNVLFKNNSAPKIRVNDVSSLVGN